MFGGQVLHTEGAVTCFKNLFWPFILSAGTLKHKLPHVAEYNLRIAAPENPLHTM